jgi:integral membrane protein (TIGR01906 family)
MMSNRAWLYRVLSLLLTLVVPVLLVLIGIRLLTIETYLRLEYAKPDFPPDDYGFTVEDRLHYGPYAVQYLTSNAGIDYLAALTFPDGAPFFNERELEHMVDVKKVMQVAFGVLGATLMFFAVIVAVLSRSADGRAALRQGLFSGGLLMIVILLGLLGYVLINWDTFFTQFHSLFFAPGSWQFAFSDSLIRLYPVRFWQDAALTIGGLCALSALVLMGGSWWSRRS